MKLSVETLKKVAFRIGIIGGLSSFVVINTIPFLYSERIRKTEHYKQAVQLLHSHPEAIKYMGEPIEEHRVNSTKRDNFGSDGENAWVRVPVSGPKDKGFLYYDYSVSDLNSPLLRVELTLTKMKDYKLLIKKVE